MYLRIARDRIPKFLTTSQSAATDRADIKAARVTPLKPSHYKEA